MGAKPFAACVPLASGLWDSAENWVLEHRVEVGGYENVEKTGFIVSWRVGWQARPDGPKQLTELRFMCQLLESLSWGKK